MPKIRIANLSDAKKLSVLAEDAFRDTYTEQNSVEDMNLHCQSSFAEAIQSQEISNPEYITLVAEDKGRLVAYAQLRRSKPPACISASSSCEIIRFYVEKDWHGKGMAQKLMSTCLETMNKHDFDVAWLGVWENNLRAISFYEKFNFQEVGEHVFSLGTDPQRDIIMVCQRTNFDPNT